MVNYKITIVDKNTQGDVIRCPQCGQVIMVVNEFTGEMRTTAQCRRCHSLVEIKVSCDEFE